MNNRKVKSIDLSSNFIGRDGLSALAKLLRVNRNIETLKYFFHKKEQQIYLRFHIIT